MKGFIWLILPHQSLSSEGVRTGLQARLEPGGADAEAMKVCSLLACSHGLLSLLSYRTWDHQPRGMPPPTVDWALPHQSLIKKKHSIAGSYEGIFSVEAPSSDGSSLCQVDIKLSSTISEASEVLP